MLKRLSMIVAAGLLAFGFGGVATAHQEDTLKKIKDRGTLNVGVAESKPMNIRNPATGEWSGFNIAMARDLAENLGVKLNLQDATYATLIPGLLSGKHDIVMAALFATTKRAAVVGFTDYYSSGGMKIAVRQDSAFTSWEDLNNQQVTFTAISGTVEEGAAKKQFPKAKMKAMVTDDTNVTFLEVASGRAHAHMTDISSINLFLRRNPQSKLKILEPDRVANVNGRGYAVRRDDWRFLNFLNVWLFRAVPKYQHLLKIELDAAK